MTASLALFIAIGGGAYAATNPPVNSVGTAQLKNGAVTTPKLHNGAVTTSKLHDGAVTTAKLAPHATVFNANNLGGNPASAYVSKVDIVNASGTSDATTTKTKTVDCPSGTRLVGGGAQLFTNSASDDGKVALNSSSPSGGNVGWFARAVAVNGGPAGSWSIHVFAVCVS